MKRFQLAFAAILMFSASLPAFAQQMPSATKERIKTTLAEKYPDNYSVQKTLLEGQIDSYKFLQNYSPSEMPAAVCNSVKQTLLNKYPDNFSVVKTLLEGQVKSYRELHN